MLKPNDAQLERLKSALDRAEAVLIGAGAGLSTAAGLTYSGERFHQLFGDFEAKFGIRDMYSGGFYPFPDAETRWAWWSRHIWHNRYIDAPKPVYPMLLSLVKDKDYFVLTTNVDHQFQRAGFDKKRLFYTQGDYGLLQCSKPCSQRTWDNEEQVREMLKRQRDMRIPTELIPKCPICGREMTTNLRADDRFVQDEGWYAAAGRYEDYLAAHVSEKLLLLELGVGGNTPVIIKYPFWRMTAQNPDITYACLNLGEAVVPDQIAEQSICIDADIAQTLEALQNM